MRESMDFLEPLTGAPKRKKFCTVDIESKDEDSRWKAGFTRPFLIGTYDPLRRLYAEFGDEPILKDTPWQERALGPGGCIGKVMAYLLSPAFVGYTIYAHNGGSFDHLFWLRWLRLHDDEYGFEVIPVQSSIQIIKVWKLPENAEDPIKDRWTFLDSMKLFPAGLEKLCKTFGLPGKVNQDLDVDEDDPSWSIYLKQDCIALADGLTKIHDLVEDKLGGEVGMTAPSTSMKLFRRRFLGRKGSVKRIPRFAHWPDCQGEAKEKCPGCAHEWIRLGYYGGRTELFQTYGEHLQYFDINSSYVAAMRELMPVGDRMVTTELDWSMTDTHGGFVECTVRIPPECEYPPLPHRAKKTGKLLFPTGRFSGVWSTKELALLKDPSVNGEILSVRKVVWFRLKEVFTGMVDELWNLRSKCLPKCKTKGCEGCNPDFDEGLSALAKLFGNAQPLDEPVLTPSGWRAIGSLNVGDEVVGSSGEVVRVTGVYPQGVKPVYVFRCGERVTRCCGDHLWRATPATSGVPVVARTSHLAETIDALWMVPVLGGEDAEITSITLEGDVECVCISVDAEDHLYVTRDNLVTHNSLYGKWAMKHERTSIVFSKFNDSNHCFLCQKECEDGLCTDCEGSKPASDHSGDVWYKANRVEAAYIIPHISSWITSLARIRLWQYMRQAVDAGGIIYYSDTDSIITDVTLPSSNELGGLKNEYPGHNLTGTFVQPKVYMLESDKFDQPKVTMKGFPYRNVDSPHKTCACDVCKASKKPVHVKSDKEFKSCPCPECIIRCKENLLKLQAGETLEWRQLEKIRTLAAIGFKRGPVMRKVKKSFRGSYDKRVIQPDGVTTKAVMLDEHEEENAFHEHGEAAAEE